MGLPFVGQAGKLLDKLLAEIALDRKEVFVANMLKCRPPDNRDPHPNEIEACQDYLRRQVDLIEPTVICTLGNFSTKLLRADSTGISRLHGQRGGADHRAARRPAVSALSPGGGAVHAVDARGAAGRLPPDPRPAGARAARAARVERSRAEVPEPSTTPRTDRRSRVGRLGARPEIASRPRAARVVLARQPGGRRRGSGSSMAGRSRGELGSGRRACGRWPCRARAPSRTRSGRPTIWTASTTVANPFGSLDAWSRRIGSATATRPSGSRNQVRLSASMYCTARYVAASTVNATPRMNSASTAPRRFDPNAARISGVDPNA